MDMRSRGRMRVGLRAAAFALAAVVTAAGIGAAGGRGRPVRAQSAVPSTSVLAAPGAPSFRLPAEAELTSDAGLPVTDAPPADLVTLDADHIISTAAAAIEAMPADQWDLDAVATSLGDDPRAAFEFVRDRIAFDPYPGILRGPEGTLNARGGNALDRALLLRALLDRMGATARFALGEVRVDVAQAVLERAFADPAAPLQDGSSWALPSSVAAQVVQRARRDYALLRGALDDRLGSVEVAQAGDRLADVSRHAWVQVEREGDWVDLDPTMPDAVPGMNLVTAAQTTDELPAGDHQAITLRVIAETVGDGGLSRSVVLEQRFDAVVAGQSQLLLVFAGDPDAGDGGLLGGGAPTSFVPVLIADGVPTTGQAFSTDDGGGGDDGFGGFGGGLSGETAPALSSLVLSATIERPGHLAEERRSVLLDRLPAEARATGAPTAGDLEALVTTDAGPLALAVVRHVMISTGASSPLDHAYGRANAAYFSATSLADPATAAALDLSDALWPMTTADRTLVLGSERAIVPALDDGAVRAFVGRPRVYVMSIGSDGSTPDGLLLTTDLVSDPVDIIPLEGAGPEDVARRQLWYGVLEGALETELALRLAGGFDPVTREVSTTSLAMSLPLTVLSGGDLGSLPPTAPAALRAALTAGDLVVVPGDPGRASAWWTVAAGGATRAILDPGLGGSNIKVKPPPSRPVPRVGPAQKPPKQLPEKQPPQDPFKGDKFEPAKQPKPGGKPPGGGVGAPPPDCPGNEYLIMNRCVSLGTIVVVSILAVVGIGITIAAVGGIMGAW